LVTATEASLAPEGTTTPLQPQLLLARLTAMAPDELARVAFRWSGGAMTFALLQERMLRLAAWLRQEAGVATGDRVLVCLPKSPEAVVALYGTMAAGGVYSPVQYQDSADRLNAVAASMQPKVILTSRPMAGQFAGYSSRLHAVDLAAEGTGFEALTSSSEPLAAPFAVECEDLAWIIHTSGSTGEPKGVMLSHRAMAANVEAMQQRDRMSTVDRRISHAPLHYISAFDLLFPLVSGVQIYLLPEKEAMFPERVGEVMERERTTIWSSSATALRLLLERGALAARDLSAMRRISFYGEAMPMATLRQIMAALPHVEFVNHYGATEADLIASFPVPRPLPETMVRLPLGWPADKVDLTLRDAAGNLVPDGEIGEICLVGPGVTSGYWGDPVLSAARRMPGIAQSHRTGDLAYRSADGILHSAGRTDQMVKIRGQRLDIGEVEAVLRLHPLVRDALAVATGEPDLTVKAVVLSEGGHDLLAELDQLCRRRLPRHGRPVRITVLAKFPQLATGKVDRLALRQRALA
jgi:amino acid adenylation domain-containing protein